MTHSSLERIISFFSFKGQSASGTCTIFQFFLFLPSAADNTVHELLIKCGTIITNSPKSNSLNSLTSFHYFVAHSQVHLSPPTEQMWTDISRI